MGGEAVKGSWLSGLFPISRKSDNDKVVIGILASEVSSLMLKIVHLWHSLSDNEVTRLREEIVNSLGLKILVSDDDDFLMELALNELLSNLQCLARSVASLSKRCEDPVYHSYEQFVNNPVQNRFQWFGWEYRWKKMERKVKKMERFAAVMTHLSQEIEVLQECEQTYRRMRANPRINRVKLLQFRKRVVLHRQEVTTLRDMSPWNRSYDYIVRLLARSLFTILERIILVFGNYHHQNGNERSYSPFMYSYVHNSHEIYSNSRKKKEQQAFQSHIGHFRGCMSVGTDSPVIQTGGSMRFNSNNVRADKISVFSRKRIYSKLSIKGELIIKPGPSTLGDAALALHYANVILLIEKMASSIHLIDQETRDVLYNLLPTTIKSGLRDKFKGCGKRKASSSLASDANIAAGWNMVVRQILQWLAPLAHNMIRWHCERNFGRDHTSSKPNVLLVHTLYFANQATTEAAIVELLVGLNYNTFSIPEDVANSIVKIPTSTINSSGVTFA
ncbi:uncharacterized protein G2W53_043457 [Senna tora]|uniref:Uncharacterized protein n=1 Tax=Senna tora TaxID=362788 RepID=A0A834SIP2_9FABA|nr:uncharacterized protein G2W53_043457 [Senna tora]